MQSDLGKLFIGGIAWDTNEERLHEYFSRYGEVLECVIMKDRATGRGRGFGFVVFADPLVAERITKEKHNIDGRMVEAKKAVPRTDQTALNRNISIIKSSPIHGQTRKIFVGGLASTVTEIDFKLYFEQFGTITDAVVMHDLTTKRPRGFGFITYDSEEAVNNVLSKTFHQLNGKMVEVKRAIPKDSSPGQSQIQPPLGAYPYGLNRINNIVNGFAPQGPYSPNPIRGYDVRMGLNYEAMTSGNYNNNNNNTLTSLSYGRGLNLNPYYVGNSSRFMNPIGFDGGNGSNISFFNSNPRDPWSNGGVSSIGSGSGVIGGGIFSNTTLNSSVSPVSPQSGGNLFTQSSNHGYSRNMNARGFDVPFSDFYASGGGGSDLTWRLDRDGTGSGSGSGTGTGTFGAYGLAGGGSEDRTKSPHGYVGGYSVNNRHPNRGIND